MAGLVERDIRLANKVKWERVEDRRSVWQSWAGHLNLGEEGSLQPVVGRGRGLAGLPLSRRTF